MRTPRSDWSDGQQIRAEAALSTSVATPTMASATTIRQRRDRPSGWEWAYMLWLAVANSCIDFVIRKKVALSVSYTVLDSMPLPPTAGRPPAVTRLGPLARMLTCTAPDMAAYWKAMAAHGWCDPIPEGTTPPGLLDDASRAAARAEIDAAVARDLFGLTANDLAGILDTFPSCVGAKRESMVSTAPSCSCLSISLVPTHADEGGSPSRGTGRWPVP